MNAADNVTLNLADRLACLHDLPVTYEQVALPLVDRGWPVVPLHPATKVPSRKGWQHRATMPACDLRQMVEQELGWIGPADRRGAAVGIVVLSTLLVIDCDRTDPHEAGAVWQAMVAALGEPDMVRIGRSPKFMSFYAAGTGVRSRRLRGIDVFCGSGQFAAFGLHGTTGRPYAWSERNPLNTRPTDLRMQVSPPQIEQFIGRLVAAGILSGTIQGSRRSAAATDTTQGRALASGAPYEATVRLHELFDRCDGRVKPAVRQLIAEVGAAGCGRHNAVVALCGRLVMQRWTDEQSVSFVVPLVNEYFGEGDWTDEVRDALRHARSCEAARFVYTELHPKTVAWLNRSTAPLVVTGGAR